MNIYIVLINAGEICQEGFFFLLFLQVNFLLFFHLKHVAEWLERSLQGHVSQD